MTDIFPANVTVYPHSLFSDPLNFQEISHALGNYNTGGTNFSPCRVIFTDVIYVGMDNHPNPQTVYQNSVTQTLKVAGGYVLSTPDSIVFISKIENCGCGSRLRSWSPFRTLFR